MNLKTSSALLASQKVHAQQKLLQRLNGDADDAGNDCVNDLTASMTFRAPSALKFGSRSYQSQLSQTFLAVQSESLVRTIHSSSQDSKPTGIQAAVGRTRALEPHEIGTLIHAQEVASSGRSMMQHSGIPKDHVHLVLISVLAHFRQGGVHQSSCQDCNYYRTRTRVWPNLAMRPSWPVSNCGERPRTSNAGKLLGAAKRAVAPAPTSRITSVLL